MSQRIQPFLETDSVFDPDTLHAMGEAFDRVRTKLNSSAPGELELRDVAAIIIAHARGGERDVDRLCASVCQRLGMEI